MAVMLTSAVFADLITPYGFAQTSLRERLMSMNAAHWLGTDQLGRDLLTTCCSSGPWTPGWRFRRSCS
ncbi:MAG: hypothetical protein HY725_22650 [Candidatus Rokubacteria bacterium]|nr:hypothetical protein [Candidatus Rokubacteria bacterium]